ncbi:hypothetical protein [Moorena sp. SIO3I6]|uniref:hypothetical protein n=1 Tax=Moorena sp. SIO3I6 TaxID=2607831 RepID=UPI0013FB4FC9|nr:hypothetical protein [Moorena sp. SIO3I6]NEP28480.1 hypothetical protein [Moorena sp. SIO3I6]
METLGSREIGKWGELTKSYYEWSGHPGRRELERARCPFHQDAHSRKLLKSFHY